jgi:hypothetical protein
VSCVHSSRFEIRAIDLIDHCFGKDLQKFGLRIMCQRLFALLLSGEIIEIGDDRVLYKLIVRIGLRATATDIYFFIFIVHTLLFLKTKFINQTQFTNKISKN